MSQSDPAPCRAELAGAEGIEPPSTELETVILPLDDAPVFHEHPRQDSNLHIAA